MPIKLKVYMARIILFSALLIHAFLGGSRLAMAESWIDFSDSVEMIKLEIEQKTIDLFGTVDSYSVNNAMEVLEDIPGELSIDQVSSGDYEDRFIPSSGAILNAGITGYSYWIRFTLSSHPSIADITNKRLWYLEVGRSQLNIAALYTPQEDGSYKVQTADIRKPFSERDVVHVNSVFPVKTLLYEEKTYYLNIRNDNALFVPLTLWNPIAFAEKVAYEEFVYGLFFGGMLIMAFYNVFVFLSVRDQGYLYYFLYVFSIAFWQFIENGHGLTIFGDGGGMLSKYYLPQLLMFSFFMMIQFTRVFLETEKDMPGTELVFNIFKMTIFVSAVSAFFVDYISTQIWMSGVSLVLMIVLLITASFSWVGGNESARYFFAGILATVSGGILFVGVLEGVLPATPLLLAAAPIGTLAGAVLLSFALADRIKFLQSTALAANQRSMESLTKFRSIFDNAVEGMYRMTLDGSMVSANLSMAKLLGYSTVDTLLASGVEASKVCYSDPITQYDLLSKDGVFQTEIAYERRGGGNAWGRHSAQLILDANGKPSHIEGTLVDITARKEKEQAEREREKNRVEKEVASASASAKGEFLANMSHEIRTPLTAIIGYSESLYDEELTFKEEQNAVDTIIRSSHHLLGLIDDILDFSKIEAHQLEVEQIDVDIALLMKDIESYFIMKAVSQGLSFKIDYQFPIPSKVIADPKRLKQILLNLCSNALKFTKEGGVTIEVGWDEGRKLMRFAVCDTGIGLTEKQLGKLFQEFSQADESTARNFGGTGLGLVISKTLAELMGGTIDVTSVPGEGSCFSAYIGGELPDRQEWISSWDTSKKEDRKRVTKGLSIPVLSGKILYAEDNPVNQKLVAMLVKKTGAELILVENGKEAVEQVENNDFDLVLMDIQMPVMNGVDAIKSIRDKGYTLPILALTANVMQEDVKMYKKVGSNGCLAKPIVRPVFYQMLDSYLGEEKVGDDV
ncbi:hypothetical protein A9Q81_01895 [Gammaproteobacteria bacterium 42_54_T18]|nr:hypothetical protein A9Q81_01895 [Gammaproteobacteria bacterium 42_54_T18]